MTVPLISDFSYPKTLLGSAGTSSFEFDLTEFAVSDPLCPIEKFMFTDLTTKKPDMS